MGDGGHPVEPDPPILDVASPAEPETVRLQLLLDPASAPGRSGAARPLRIVWHDDAERRLSAAGLALGHDGSQWSLERLGPGDGQDWPACRPPEVLASGADLGALSLPDVSGLQPVSAFEGTVRRFASGGVEIEMLHGMVRGVAAERVVCRLGLAGPAQAVAARLSEFAPSSLGVPRGSLAQEAMAAAAAAGLPARHLGSPALDGGTAVGDGLAIVVGHLLDALLVWTDRLLDGADEEAVHQARVATRRLRSALSVYRGVASPALAGLADDVKHCAAMLGAVRDWDVFLHGVGAATLAASEGDRRVADLLRAARRQREVAWTGLSAYLRSDAFRALTLALGVTTALPAAAELGAAVMPMRDFAAAVLTRGLKRVRRAGRGMRRLPTDSLHELRKDCKRLRYAAEFFLPAFGGKLGKAFVHRLSGLQEQLGHLNDAATCTALVGQLGRLGRGYAGGMAIGMSAAAAQPARARAIRRWKRFKRAEPFWA